MSLRRHVGSLSVFCFIAVCFIIFLRIDMAASTMSNVSEHVIKPAMDTVKDKLAGANKEKSPPHPTYKPTPTYRSPPIQDPFPLLATSTPPPIPKWNMAREGLHKEYDLPTAPPLLIGFTRTWPLLLQAVVSYVTAGWPPSQIYVVENTGVQQANARGQLTLQNPFYLNHAILKKLGVNIIQTPVLLSFAQLQNFYLSLTYKYNWPYFFWSHMDVLTISYEEGFEGLTPPYKEKGYKTVYELCCVALNETLATDPRWGLRFFAYDHLSLVNPLAYEDVGGWDTLIPYYLTDCDMHTRLAMANWSIQDRTAGIITDVSTTLKDLRALYRQDKGVVPDFVDPNPPPPMPENGDKEKRYRIHSNAKRDSEDPELEYWRALRHVSDRMFQYKHGDRGRNTWQQGQHGGFGEKFYYPSEGVAEGIDVITEAGREVYRRKWGHRDCDLIEGAGLKLWDQWRVEKDWKD